MKGSNDSMMLRGADAPALGVEERSDEAPRAGGAVAPRAPDPEVVAKPTRRRFSAEYRLRILEEADRCTQPGEIGRLLRGEGLYSSHLSVWRKARRNGSLKALTPKKRGAKPAESNPLSGKVRQLEAKVTRLESRTHRNVAVVALANKLAPISWALLIQEKICRPRAVYELDNPFPPSAATAYECMATGQSSGT